MKKTWIRTVKDLVVIFIAAGIYAVGISLFLDPNNLAPGGVTGIAVILNRLSHLRYSLSVSEHTGDIAGYVEIWLEIYY